MLPREIQGEVNGFGDSNHALELSSLADLYTSIPLTDAIGYYHQSQLHTVCAASPVPVTKEQTYC